MYKRENCPKNDEEFKQWLRREKKEYNNEGIEWTSILLVIFYLLNWGLDTLVALYYIILY